jgi:hypothetical protein
LEREFKFFRRLILDLIPTAVEVVSATRLNAFPVLPVVQSRES